MSAPVIFPLAGRRVWVAGHTGLVGRALVRRLDGTGCALLTVDRAGLDLRRQTDTEAWLAAARPDAVFLAAATVGGIAANQARPADFLYDNLMIAANVIEAARRTGVARLLVLGSSCIYPRLASQPMAEEALLDGPLEPTNQWYAVAKIAAIKLCQACRRQYGSDFIAAMPTNLYGPHDNFDPERGHVLPALLRRMHEARQAGAESLDVWGSGRPLREFLHADDLAEACVFLMERYSGEEIVNIGSGEELRIADLARLIAKVIGYRGALRFDPGRPDGAPRKLVDSTRLRAMGWAPAIPLSRGIEELYAWYCGRGPDRI
ncbi:MAG: NAD-dependent epimerase/dehydratase family protein [Gammaproteobacteria bacterium]|nr:NAD-dependent epimerase/dehydratase family protein [Gammaproteobacteria bacterium]